MIIKLRRMICCTAIIIIGFNPLIYSQATYKISNSEAVSVTLSGTSTLHDWTMDAHELSGTAVFDIKVNIIKTITALSFSLPVENLKSKEKAMDTNAYEALKTDTFKTIVFKLTSASIETQQSNQHTIKAVGNLFIAGVTREIMLDVLCLVNKDKTINCTGTQKIKMTDYRIKPPTFLFGAMKTGDEIVLDFNLVFKK